MKNLKTTLPLLLKKRGWTYKKLSQATGISKSTLHSWTTQNAVSLDQLKIVATAMEVSVHSLAYGEPDPFEIDADELIEHLFTGDLRVSISKISRTRRAKK